MNIIGIDPGFFGAAGILFENSYEVYDAPVAKINGRTEFLVSPMSDIIYRWMIPHQELVCVIEKVSSRPGEGSVSSFRFGFGVGLWVGICAAFHIPVIFVSPQRWKADLNLGRDKEKSLVLARKLFPKASLKRKKDDGRAEALLIAHWYRQKDKRNI